MANLRKIAEGKYRIDWRDDRGRRYRKFFEKRKDAESALTDVQKKLETGAFIAPREVPAFAEIAREWIQSKKAGNYRPATLEAWRIHLDNHLLNEDHGIGHLRLNRIDVATVERFAQRRKDAGLAAQTVNKILTTAAAVLSFAVRHKKTITNAAAEAERLKVGSQELAGGEGEARTGDQVQEEEVLNPDQLRLLLEHAGDPLWQMLLQTAALTGARHDELLALMWTDIDLDAGRLTIRRNLSWAKIEKGEPTRAKFFPPKTKAGRRSIDVPPELVHAMKVWKLQCPKGELDLVFPSVEGKPLHRSNVLRLGLYPAAKRATAAAKKAGVAPLPPIDMHTLRHTFASMLIMAGEPPTRVANLLGHSTPAVTMSVYAHWFKDVKTDAVNTLAQRLMGARPIKSAHVG